MLTRDKSVNLILEVSPPDFDEGKPLAIIDEEDRKVDLMVSSGPVVSIIPKIKSEDGQPIPFPDSQESRAALGWVNGESGACLVHYVILF
jgi:hypothetical protein